MPSRKSSITATQIVYDGYLIADDKGGMRFSRMKPSLKANEVCVAVQLQVPRSAFKKPAYSVVIDASGARATIDKAEVVKTAAKALTQALPFAVTVNAA